MEKTDHIERIEKVYEFTVSKGQKPERLDRFLTRSVQNTTRTKVQKAIEEGRVLVNGSKKKVSYKIAYNDFIRCVVMKLPPIELLPENIPLNITFEDDFLMVINKPAGMCVHPGIGNRDGTLVNALLYYLGVDEPITVDIDDEEEDSLEENDDDDDERDELSEDDEKLYDENLFLTSSGVRPCLVHRIDKDTTGLLVVAKNAEIHRKLSEQFINKTTEREYNAIVWGKPKNDFGRIENNIGRSPRDRKSFAVVERGGKIAITEYKVLERFLYTSLLQFRLKTGRTHQIRVHSADIGHKLFGDERYGGAKVLLGGENPQWKSKMHKILQEYPRQMLHAKTLGFVHPVTKEKMSFNSELPDDMQYIIEVMREFST